MDSIRFAFRESPSGFKQTLISLPINSKITVEQASGNFFLTRSTVRSQVFIAGGIGITPFMSFLTRENLLGNMTQPVTLLYGNRDNLSAAYITGLRRLSQETEQFSLIELYDKPSLETFRDVTMLYTNSTWSVVGPPGMVALAVQGLRLGGVSVQDIHTESFGGY
jgi:ferredoxin-NADP reductase